MEEHKGIRNLVAILLAALLCVGFVSFVGYHQKEASRTITVGFIYDNDELTPYSYDFYLAQKAVQDEFQERVRVIMYSNILEENVSVPLQKMVDDECDIIFTNCYGDVRSWAQKYPNIQFCQVSSDFYPDEEAVSNYHTFKGEIYQGRYASGVVAGLKLRQMINEVKITPQQAKVGYVAAFPYPEVISGYTAFILGVRSVVPEATLHVRYIDSWSCYTLEKACAYDLLEEGCVVISQHTDTLGPAVACEEWYSREVYHVGYNIDMTKDAPYTSLTSAQINWTPYILNAVKAVMQGKEIEDVVDGSVHPNNDMSAGFDHDWVRLTPLKESLLPEGTTACLDEVIAGLASGEIEVFKGDYIGVNPNDPTDIIDLSEGFIENEDSSIPSFHYILKDVVFVE